VNSAAKPMDVRLMRLGANLLFALAALALVAAGLVKLVRAPWFDFRQIRVVGDVAHNTAATLRANALARLNGSYLTLDLAQARDAFEQVPWVRHAQVQRVWPHTLVVQLEEHRPAAYWERESGDDQLVNVQGEVFDVNLGDVEDEELPKLRGPQGTAAQVLSMYRRLGPVLGALQQPRALPPSVKDAPEQAEAQQIVKLGLSDRGSWRVRLSGGAVIELGRGDENEVAERAGRFVRTVGEVSARFGTRAVEYADLRHNEGYALRLAGMGTVEGKPKPGQAMLAPAQRDQGNAALPLALNPPGGDRRDAAVSGR